MDLGTGSIVRHGGEWRLFYTGVSGADSVQRIGCARSTDLVSWTRLGDGPLVEADPTWYETVRGGGACAAWRDPWVFRDEDTGVFHMFVTARANAGPADGHGVIGHAWSADLLAWQVGPPISTPGEFAALEVPQLVRVEAAWWILFSALAHDHSAARLRRPGVRAEGGTHYLRATHKLGPYALERDRFLVGDPFGRHYAGRMLRRGDRWYYFAWQAYDDDGAFVGALSDPVPVLVKNGRATVHMT
jgi:beta-fructofuranosidase